MNVPITVVRVEAGIYPRPVDPQIAYFQAREAGRVPIIETRVNAAYAVPMAVIIEPIQLSPIATGLHEIYPG